MNGDIEEFRAYYNATLHLDKNNDATILNCCSVTLIIKSTFCSVVKFVFEVCISINLKYVK